MGFTPFTALIKKIKIPVLLYPVSSSALLSLGFHVLLRSIARSTFCNLVGAAAGVHKMNKMNSAIKINTSNPSRCLRQTSTSARF